MINNDVSYWHTTVPHDERPPLRGDAHADVAIIGGGFTGLSTAHALRRRDSSLRVAVLESSTTGYGASGRNGGFAMTLFGLTLGFTAVRFGKHNARHAHQYMQRAVDHVGTLVHEHRIDCDYGSTGLLTVANAPAQIKRLQHEVKLAQELGLEGIEWLDQAATRALVNSPLYGGARYEDRCALINPAKLVRGLRRIAEEAGASVYERTPVGAWTLGKGSAPHRLETPYGTVHAERVVFATNAFSAAFPQLAGKAFPVYTYIVLTVPLTPEQLEQIGWQERHGIEDGRNLVHYYRLTADNRVLMGGGDVLLTHNGALGPDHHARTFRDLEQFVGQVFPHLRGIEITHRWGGPVSVPLDMAPALGYVGTDKRAVYSLGCVGHGVAYTTYVGHLLADMLLDRPNVDRALFWVNRRTVPLPPEPLRFGVGSAIRAALRAQDRSDERHTDFGV